MTELDKIAGKASIRFGNAILHRSMREDEEARTKLKDEVKLMMLELFKHNYQVLPIQPNGKPLYFTEGITVDKFSKLVNEL